MRYSGYRSMEKRIAASDSGGKYERWKYGHTLLTDETKTTANGHLKNHVLANLIEAARKAGVKISEREIRRRLECARAYPTEAEFGRAAAEFENWWDLVTAGFPQAEATEDAGPSAPQEPVRKPTPKPGSQPPLVTSSGQRVPEFDPPVRFGGDEHGPRSTIEDLYAACKESEGYTERMAVNDAKRRAYVDDLAGATGGDLTKTWYEAEVLRRGLDAFGLSGLDDFNEIMGEFFKLWDSGQVSEPDEPDDDDGDE